MECHKNVTNQIKVCLEGVQHGMIREFTFLRKWGSWTI